MENLVLESTAIKNLKLENRVVVAPMTRVSTKGDGIPTEQMQSYYARYAKGGFGLIITEGAYTDRLYSQAYPNQAGITNDQQQKGWQDVASAIHNSGGAVFLQLMHAGALSQQLSNTRAPSPIEPLRKMLEGYSQQQGRFAVPHAMNLSEIDDVIQGFVNAAVRAEKAGFDGVEIHAANGYLLDQFLTEYTNRREDSYGGSLKNRCLLITQVIAAVKSHVANNFVVGVRLSQAKVNDFDYLWPGGANDAKIIFSEVENAGADYIHFASEGKGFEHSCFTQARESLPKLARSITNLPVIANGALHQLDKANQILREGHADLIALGTSALANPDWPHKAKNGKTIEAFNPDMFSRGVTIENQFDWENRI